MADGTSTFDKTRQSVTKRCRICWWRFRCPIEQLRREMCRSCESIADEIIREAANAVQPPT